MRAGSMTADRDLGEMAVVETLPATLVDLFGLLTRLGDPVTLLLVVVTGYLLADYLGVSSTRMATALALALGGFAATLALKHAFALPRPPGAGTDGYGFPSGHALGATVVYGGLAALFDDRRLSAAAAGLVVVVATSRVVIGVHYLADVVVGVAVGLGYVAAGLGVGPGRSPERVTAAETGRTFALAVAVGLVALAAAVVTDTVVAAAATAGGWIGWRVAGDRVVAAAGSTRRLVASFALLPGVVVVALFVLDGGVTLPVAGGLAGGTVALLLAIPGLSG
ncbi:phosphatase PAP2 family protein [Haloplanus pelagicus]|uniref:phosphatase PAP2 family protein n=1 Tax=Haloplanus pelagicus TaxID=2949995 RepID=UPI0020400F43|nr:phosphatase PAP2 family protein [Haloplanus sp. HW8-1]